MTAAELADHLSARLVAGELDPGAEVLLRRGGVEGDRPVGGVMLTWDATGRQVVILAET